jgi:hypothetical protein
MRVVDDIMMEFNDMNMYEGPGEINILMYFSIMDQRVCSVPQERERVHKGKYVLIFQKHSYLFDHR